MGKQNNHEENILNELPHFVTLGASEDKNSTQGVRDSHACKRKLPSFQTNEAEAACNW